MPSFASEEWDEVVRSWDLPEFVASVAAATFVRDSEMLRVTGCDGRVLLYAPAEEVTIEMLEPIFLGAA